VLAGEHRSFKTFTCCPALLCGDERLPHAPPDQRIRPTSNLLEGPVVLSHEPAYFPCDLSYSSLSLSLVHLNGAIGQLLFDSTVWWFEPTPPAHPSFVLLCDVCERASS
jgi:hypothetical protein